MGLKINPDPLLQDNLMAFGFECDEGWFPLIKELIEILQNVKDCDFDLLQVKEKYATLRFYISGGSDEVHDVISKYEIYSEHICEHCGQFYTTRIRESHGWLKTLCDKCAKKLKWD